MSKTNFTPFYKDYDKMTEYIRNGYSWFDMMYPRGSDAEAKELKIGKYADPKLDELMRNKEVQETKITDTRLSGHKRKRPSY